MKKRQLVSIGLALLAVALGSNFAIPGASSGAKAQDEKNSPATQTEGGFLDNIPLTIVFDMAIDAGLFNIRLTFKIKKKSLR